MVVPQRLANPIIYGGLKACRKHKCLPGIWMICGLVNWKMQSLPTIVVVVFDQKCRRSGPGAPSKAQPSPPSHHPHQWRAAMHGRRQVWISSGYSTFQTPMCSWLASRSLKIVFYTVMLKGNYEGKLIKQATSGKSGSPVSQPVRQPDSQPARQGRQPG